MAKTSRTGGGTNDVRQLNDTERVNRRDWIRAHPGQPEPGVTSAHYAIVQDWLDRGKTD